MCFDLGSLYMYPYSSIERVKTTCTVYECTKYLVYEKVIIELKKITSFMHETDYRVKKKITSFMHETDYRVKKIKKSLVSCMKPNDCPSANESTLTNMDTWIT